MIGMAWYGNFIYTGYFFSGTFTFNYRKTNYLTKLESEIKTKEVLGSKLQSFHDSIVSQFPEQT